jgi:hypothetical protein
VRALLPVCLALAAGLALRLWMLNNFFDVNGDTLIYGGLAKNLLLHGRYALEGASGEIYPTLIRLPGYPLFLALCFRVFGMENYASAAWVQIPLDLAGCLLLMDFVRRVAAARLKAGAAQGTLWLAALCPFTAIYAVQPLTEGLTLFFLALALWSTARFIDRQAWSSALWFTLAVTSAALLRPDGALAAVVLAPALAIGLGRGEFGDGRASGTRQIASEKRQSAVEPCLVTGHDFSRAASAAKSARAPHLTRMLAVCLLLAATPFAAWTGRNWKVFHVVQPLAPRYANDPGEPANQGWVRWVKSWCLDFVSTYDIYWNVPQGTLEMDKLPARAFDSPAQFAETAALAADYNSTGQQLTRAIDARFEKLAEERIAAHPLRSFVWLPLGRVADMWLRPRVENLPIDLDWWVYAHHNNETLFSWAYALLNALYLLLALAGLCLRPRLAGALVAYMLLRSALLLTVEAPEARYTIECFPMLFALGGIGVCGGVRKIAALGERKVRFRSQG